MHTRDSRPPSRLKKTPSRRRAPKKRDNPLIRLGKALYILLVILSAIIVFGYLAFPFLVPEPEVAPPASAPVPEVVQPEGEQPGGDRPPEEQLPPEPVREPLVRREGVYNILLAGTDFDGYRTDTMMVVSYDTKAHTVGVVSVPRDTLVDRPAGQHNHLVYGKGGISARRDEISDMLGIPIDYHIKVNLTAFVALVDQVGGVDFYVPCDMNYDDPYQDLSIHYTEGMQHLTGQQAMEVARFRQNNPDEEGNVTGYWDTGRTQTQQQLLMALAKKVLSWNSLTDIKGFVEIFNDYVETDLSLSDMLYLASQAIYVDLSTGVTTKTLEGDGNVRYGGYSYCYALEPQAALDTVNTLLNPYTRDLELDELNIVVP